MLVLMSMVLAACTPAATPTPTQAVVATQPTASTQPPAATNTPAPTTAPAATAAPTATSAPTFKGTKVDAGDCAYGGELKTLEAVDANTVKFTLCAPDVAFQAKIAFAAFPILSQAQLDSTKGDSAQISTAPVGTGPYIIKEWVRGDHMTLVPNPNYWGTAPANKTLIIKWAKEPAQRLLEVQSGNADGFDNPSPDDLATIKADANLKLYPRPVPNVMYFGMNNTKPPFDKEEVRQAFAMAIDRARIVKNFYPEGSVVPDQFAPATTKPGFTDGLKWYDFDPVAAKALLVKAGFDFTQTITFSYRDVSRSYVPQPGKVAQDLQAQMADIGIKIKLDVQESGTLLANSKEGNLQFFLLGWGEDYPDATDWYDYHFNANKKDFGTPFPDIVDAMKKGATSADPVVRQAAYDVVNKLVKQHVPAIPIVNSVSFAVFKSNVKNVLIGPYNENFQQMANDSGTLVWVQSAEPISLWCGDEEDGETFRVCDLLFSKLLDFKFNTAQTESQLAEKVTPNADLTEWTLSLKKGVKFSGGTDFTANDVVASFAAMWDYTNPDHKGNTGVFTYFNTLFGNFLHQPPPKS